MIAWEKCPAVESRPGKLGGEWVFRGTRVPVNMLFTNLVAGATVAEFLEWFEGIAREDVVQVLEFVVKESRSPNPPGRDLVPA